MFIKDKIHEVEIKMQVWDYCEWSPDFSPDFFNAGNLEAVEDDHGNTVYIVPDVAYCIVQAKEWEADDGDYREDTIPKDDKLVTVEYI